MSSTGINMLDLKNPSIKTLHFAWMAFFITFVMWFGLGPLAAFIKAEFALTEPEWKALLMLNVAITIPSRILIGMLVDKFGVAIGRHQRKSNPQTSTRAARQDLLNEDFSGA